MIVPHLHGLERISFGKANILEVSLTPETCTSKMIQRVCSCNNLNLAYLATRKHTCYDYSTSEDVI